MRTLMLEGGWPMWFMLLFGLMALGGSARFAITARRKHLGFASGMIAATLFSILTGIVADLAAVGHNLAQHWDKFYSDEHHFQGVVMALCQGFAESMSPGVMGFTLLSLSAMICAVGLARTAKTEA